MVYYLRPRNNQQVSYKFPVNSEDVTGSDLSKNHEQIVTYLVITLLVSVISTLVILVGVKPDDNGFSFLCVKQDDGKCKVSVFRVVCLSILLGVLVAGGVFGLNKVNPELLSL